jgi:hypothetical protein
MAIDDITAEDAEKMEEIISGNETNLKEKER